MPMKPTSNPFTDDNIFRDEIKRLQDELKAAHEEIGKLNYKMAVLMNRIDDQEDELNEI